MTKTPPRPAAILKSTKKPALVLVHGFRGAPLGLETIADDLRAAGYEVYLPALPPFAGSKITKSASENKKSRSGFTKSKSIMNQSASAKPKNPHADPKSYAKFLRDYCEQQNLIRPILIGHSMGSLVVAATAQHYPERVNQKLILLSPISTKTPRFIARISPLASLLPGKIVDYITTKFLFVKPKDKNSRALFRETLGITHACSSTTPPNKSDLSAAMHFSNHHSVADFLDGLSKDFIFIAGAKDRLITQQSTQNLAAKHSAVLEFIPDSGHLHNYEKPHETAALILKHLS